jgi:hypothetical protein
MSTLHQNWRKEQNRFCLEVRGLWGEEKGARSRGRYCPNNVCTFEYMNKEKNLNIKEELLELKSMLCKSNRFNINFSLYINNKLLEIEIK